MNPLSGTATVTGDDPAQAFSPGREGTALHMIQRAATDAAERAAWMLVGATLVAAGFLLGLLFDRMTIWLGP